MQIQMKLQKRDETGKLITVDAAVVQSVLVAINAIADEFKATGAERQEGLTYEELVEKVVERSGAPADIVRALILDLPYLLRSIEKIEAILK
ncbi:MAG: hypothetical protein E7293_03500 [Lachnospiraceae bacterium]|nr:hypothetical protein [Lachnospiraceae bacterium]